MYQSVVEVLEDSRMGWDRDSEGGIVAVARCPKDVADDGKQRPAFSAANSSRWSKEQSPMEPLPIMVEYELL